MDEKFKQLIAEALELDDSGLVEDLVLDPEDNWDSICIGECVFKVVTKTKRCVFININPMTGERDIDSEPLKTLSKYRKHDNRVHFGINLIYIWM